MSHKGAVFLKWVLRQVLVFLLSIIIVASTVYFGVNLPTANISSQ